jgi:hypothetical protein
VAFSKSANGLLELHPIVSSGREGASQSRVGRGALDNGEFLQHFDCEHAKIDSPRMVKGMGIVIVL